MIYVLFLCEVSSEKAAAPLISTLRDGGLYRELIRQLCPRLIGISVLRSRTNSFLVIQFWPDEETYQSARITPFYPVLTNMLKRLTSSYCPLGVFTFPAAAGGDWQEMDTTPLVCCMKDCGLEDS